MIWVHVMAAAAFIGIAHASGDIGVTKDVGSGFRLVIKSQPTGPGVFESIAQYGYLFYKDLELGQLEGRLEEVHEELDAPYRRPSAWAAAMPSNRR